ncbi:hypothetical protein M0R45_002012 [Rubus argutus]|uniref:Retrotransposon gag domain-containing protein n=1 Tax=Rubus argutus TaxID=59490 RepID=A0AAW1VJB4_RUBAR
MSNYELSPLSAIQERIQRLRESSGLYNSQTRNLEDSGKNSSRSLSEEEEDIPEIEDQELELPMAETIRQLSNGTEGEVAPLCITYPEPAEGKEADFELKSGFLHHLPKFHGLNSEDPNKHLKEFQFVCGSMCPKNGDINILKMKAFPFSLEDRAKTWLFDLPAGHVNTWDRLKSEFLTKYFPASRITILRKQITGIQQAGDETFCAYYERFKSLVASCPSHGMKEESLLTYFYEGLLPLERSLLDAAAGGSFMDKTPAIAKELLANRALNYQQYEGALASSSRRVNEVTSHSTLEDKVNKMSTLLSQVLQQNKGGVVAQACGCALYKGIILTNALNSLRMVDGSLQMQLEGIKEGKEVLNVQGMILTPTHTTPDGGTTLISSGITMIKLNKPNKGM